MTRPDSYFAHPAYSALAIRPDGREVSFAGAAGGAWIAPIEGGPARPLAVADRVSGLSWDPDGRRLAVADEGGIFLLEGREVRSLRPKDGAERSLAREPFSPEGGLLALSTSERGAGVRDLAILPVQGGEARLLTRTDFSLDPLCWSRDGRFLAAAVERSGRHVDLAVAEIESGEVQDLTSGRPPARRDPIGFSTDGSALYLLTDEGRDRIGLARFGLRDGALEWVKTPEWDIDLARMSADGRHILYAVNEDSIHRLRLLDRNSGREPDLPPLPTGAFLALAISSNGIQWAGLHSSSRHPPHVAAYDPSQRRVAALRAGGAELPPEQECVDAEIVRIQSFDRKVPALLYRPRGAAHDHTGPALLWARARPGTQEHPDYKPLAQSLAACGFTVLLPNPRGSRGYGPAFERADDAAGIRRDYEAAAQFLRALPDVDPDRMAICGGPGLGSIAADLAAALEGPWAAAVDFEATAAPSHTLPHFVAPSEAEAAAWLADTV